MIGEHCRHLERSLMPAALRCMTKVRSDIVALWPSYFDTFDHASQSKELTQHSDQFPLLCAFAAYLEQENFNIDSNADRMALNLRTRMALHQTEAHAIKQLKSHPELLEAYRWHQISARRQDQVLTTLRSGGLASDALLVQVDFKENVRYPLSH